MPVSLQQRIEPKTCALVMQECQQSVIGRPSTFPALVDSAPATFIPNLVELAHAARRAGVRVVHSVAQWRPDGFGMNRNGALFAVSRKSPVKLYPDSAAFEVLPEIGVDEADVLLPRRQGLSPFAGSELDPLLRNAGIRTIIVCGISVNVAVMNLTFDAVNAGYDVVIPRDAVCGMPAAYVEMVFEHTLSLVSTLTDTQELLAAWASH